MALSVSRTPALRFRLQSTNSTPFASCTPTWRVASRTYATESAVYSKRRGAGASAKATHKATNVSSAAPKRTSTKVEERAAGHAGANSAVADVKALAGSSKAQLTKTPPVTSQDAAAPIETDEMKQLKELEAIEYFKKVMKSADPFGQPIAETLDVIRPQPAGLSTILQSGGLKLWWNSFVQNRVNGTKNFLSLLYLAGDDSIPGVKLGKVPWYKSFGWLFKAGKTTSTKEGTWVSPLRAIALQTYRDVNQHIANRDLKSIKHLSATPYQNELLRRVKKQPTNLKFKWNLEREVTPTQILSLRAAQYNMGREAPKFGSRFLVHAIVKFDTEQSLECYGPRGEPLHEKAEGAVQRPDGTFPAKPKRVTEYLVIEKRMWYDTPWVFRDQKW